MAIQDSSIWRADQGDGEAIVLYETLGYQWEGYQPCQGEDFILYGKVLGDDR